MFVVLHQDSPTSAKYQLKKLIKDVKEHHHPYWNYDEFNTNEPCIYYRAYQYYLDRSVVFRASVKKNTIIFEPVHYAGCSELFDIEHNVIKLVSFLLNNCYEEGVSIQIV